MLVLVEDSTRQLLAAGLLLGYFSLCIWLWRRQRTHQQPMHIENDNPLIVWASQSGNAQQLAQQLHLQLTTAGKSAHCLALDQLSTTQLKSARQIIFIVSTYGDGEAPDHARLFLKKLPAQCDLQHLAMHVLGLGDRSYPQFCHFAEQLHTRLVTQGAKISLPLMTVDNMQADAINRWQMDIADLFAIKIADTTYNQPLWCSATLLERQHLNPQSRSAGLYKLRFKTEHCNWQAGDTVVLHPDNNPEYSTREYSIASSATSGYLELIVRIAYDDKQIAGHCSGWLCQSLEIDQAVEFSLCAKPNFQAVHQDKPAIFIGAGSGLAGLRAHIAERPPLSHNWLILGERCPLTDRLLADELNQWHHSQHLTHLDYAFSRDPNTPCYVQDYLHQQQQRLLSWLEQDATIYVCGRLSGMGQGVQYTLAQLLGEEHLHRLQQQGRYRTDLY